MSISLNIREWCGIHCGGFIGKDDCNELRAIADRIDREVAEYESMKKEVDELRDELDDWKGNAEGFQPDAYMELPLDADGVPIRIGDKMDVDGDAMTVVGYRLYDGTLFLIVKESVSNCTYSPKPSNVRHSKYEPPDSWEKLEEDVNLGCRDYCEKHRLEECDYNMRVHMLARAKKLAGIEEAQR